jgi:hypothetical protein
MFLKGTALVFWNILEFFFKMKYLRLINYSTSMWWNHQGIMVIKWKNRLHIICIKNTQIVSVT